MTTITERPHDFSFAENDIRYVLQTTGGMAGTFVDIEIHYMPVDQSADILLITVSPEPDANGQIFFYLDDYLKSILLPQMPDPFAATVVQAVTAQVKYFYIRYREVVPNSPLTAWNDDLPYKKVVLLGGLEQMKFKRNNFFANYLPGNKPFLTWQPTNKQVFINQEHYLTYLHTTAETTFDVQIFTVFTDATSNTQSVTYTPQADVLFRIKAGVQALQLHLIDPAKVIYYYEIKVISAGNTLANAFRFYINYDYYYRYNDFNYINSLGGVDGMRLTGDFGWTIDTTSDDIERVKANSLFSSPFPMVQFGQANIVKKDTYKGDIGWSRTPLQQEVLLELLMSKGIYENIAGRWVGIINLTKNQDLRNNTDKKWSFPLQWSYGYADGVFTPKQLNLGAGTAYVAPPPVCIPVGLPPGQTLPDAVIGTPYNYSFNVSGSVPFNLSPAFVKPTWMTITLVGNTMSFTGTPDVVANNISVSCTINNCSNASVSFVAVMNVTQVHLPSLTETYNNAFAGTRTQKFEVGTNITAGNTFYVNVYSVTVSIVAVAGDTPSIIASKLATAVNATSAVQWNAQSSAPANGTPGFPPTASVNGNEITLVLNFGNQFGGGAY